MGKSKQDYYNSLWIIATAINLAKTSEEVLHSVVEHVAKAMEVKGCSLMLLSPDKDRLLHTASYGISDSYIGKGPISADKSIPEALEGKPVAVLNAVEDDRIQYHIEAKKEGIASILSVPMRLKLEIIGFIRVYTGETYKFTLDDIYFVGAVVNLAAIALENGRLYEIAGEDHDDLRKEILEWRSSLGHKWYTEEHLANVKE